MAFLTYTITCPDHDSASALADALLEQRLAACAHILAPVESRYYWNGALEHATEIPLEIKTRPALEREVESVVRALHPYDVPPILRVETRANADFETWLRAETGG